jgi:hypothetical protein
MNEKTQIFARINEYNFGQHLSITGTKKSTGQKIIRSAY